MNLLLIDAAEVGDGGRVRLAGRRSEHLRRVLAVEPGDELRVGILGGRKGRAEVLAVEGKADQGTVELEIEVDSGPAVRPPVDLIVALPRPQALKRVLEYAATFGVGRIDLIKAWRVEKSYFHTPVLEPERLRRHLLLGAEQGMNTWLPEVRLHRRFVPFVEELAERFAEPSAERLSLVAHPEAGAPIEALAGTAGPAEAVEIAIGPEGGWIDREVETLEGAGFRAVRLGPWILRVETALVAALAQLELLRRTG